MLCAQSQHISSNTQTCQSHMPFGNDTPRSIFQRSSPLRRLWMTQAAMFMSNTKVMFYVFQHARTRHSMPSTEIGYHGL